MSLLGSVVMPHNLFLHSEIIQSRQWNLAGRLAGRPYQVRIPRYALSMFVGWAINCAIIILAAAAFRAVGVEGRRARRRHAASSGRMLGEAAGTVFAVALLFRGLSSSITAGMAGGAIYTGIFGECYDPEDRHTRDRHPHHPGRGFCPRPLRSDPFWALVVSQMVLGIQLPITVFAQIALTSSKKVMGQYSNRPFTTALLILTGVVVTILNVLLLTGALGITGGK